MSKSLILRVLENTRTHSDVTAFLSKDANNDYCACSYKELASNFINFAHFLRASCNVKIGDHIALICDNRSEWLIADLGIQSLRAVDVPRGSDTHIEELAYILEHSDSKGCVFEQYRTYEMLAKDYPKALKNLNFVIFIEDCQPKDKNLPKKTFLFKDILATRISISQEKEIENIIAQSAPEDRATIIYTSGTTAQPKGVCLTQRAFESQIDKIIDYVPLNVGTVFLSILPVWHAYAREIQYVVIGAGATIAYSKPIGKILLEDIASSNSSYMSSVPRIWEGVHAAIYRKIRNGTLLKKGIFNLAVRIGVAHEYLKNMLQANIPTYKWRSKSVDFLVAIVPYIVLYPLRELLDMLVFKKIRKMLGPHFIAGVSGGGALAPHIDDFFAAAKITVLEGYGLTETGPVLAVRRLAKPEIRSIGRVFPEVQTKIITTSGTHAKNGEHGVLHVKTEQIMQGYYKNEEATKAVLDDEGWLNTGDIVMRARDGRIAIVGREKDTVVLSSGENVEPEHVENILKESIEIEQVMVAGQDRKALCALIVPNVEELEAFARTQGIEGDRRALCMHEQVIGHYQKIVSHCGHKLNSYEKVGRIVLLPKDFEVGKELTQTLKKKRSVISTLYKKEIDLCYK